MAEVVSSASTSALPAPAAPSQKNSSLRHSDRPLTPSPGNRKPSVSVVPDCRRVDRLLLIRLVLDLHRQSDRRAAIKLILLLLITMILCWRHYLRPVLLPDVELHRIPRNHRLLRYLHRSALIPPVRKTNLTVVPRKYPWWIYLESHQVILMEPSVSLVILGIRQFAADLRKRFGAS